MLSFRSVAAACVFVSAQALLAPPAPCCAYNGHGSATLFGTGVFSFAGEAAFATGMVMGAAPGGTAVLINSSDVETALAGWFITGNATQQTMYAFRPAPAGGAPTCVEQPLRPDQQVHGFAFCPGAAGSLFPIFGASYNVGPVGINVYLQPPTAARGSFLTPALGCAPVSIRSSSPFGGVWSVDVEDGSANAPPAAWFKMPSYC